VSLKPSKREITAKVFRKLDWEKVSIKVSVGGGMSDGAVAPASVSAAVEAAVVRNTTIHATTSLAGIGGEGAPLVLDLRGVVDYDKSGVTAVGGSATAGVKGKWLDMPTSVGLQSGFTHPLRESKAPAEANLMLKLSVDF